MTRRDFLFETPIIRLDHDARSTCTPSSEYLNGVGSIRDQAGVLDAEARHRERGQVRPAYHRQCRKSSSGNLARALAVFCKVLGLPFIPVIDPFVSPIYESFLRAHCKTVVKVTEPDDSGGYLKVRLRVVNRLLIRGCGGHLLDEARTSTQIAMRWKLTHLLTAGRDLQNALPNVDYVFIGVGSRGEDGVRRVAAR